MEKTPMYAVVTPPRPQKPQWIAWLAVLVSFIAVIVASVTAYVAKQQVVRLNGLEESILQMQIHMDQILQFNHQYLEYEYEEDMEDPQIGAYEELTVRGVVRKKRETRRPPEEYYNPVPIYEQAYGVHLTQNEDVNTEGFRLYKSFAERENEEDSEVGIRTTTENPIKPHHRVSNLWVPKKPRQRLSSSSAPELFSRAFVSAENDVEEEEDYDDGAQVFLKSNTPRRNPVMQRRSRVKATESTDRSNSQPSGPSSLNSVIPRGSRRPSELRIPEDTPTVVEQEQPNILIRDLQSLASPYTGNKKKKFSKKRPIKKGRHRSGRRRLSRSGITLAHYVAAPANITTAHVSQGARHEEWTAATWMDKLGLNKKYVLQDGAVTVKQSGLYYIYAQVLYELGRFGSGYQIMVDGIPVMECSIAPAQPTHSCHTSGTTYLQRNAVVTVRDIERHMIPVRKEASSFFGLIKLMDAPATAEKLLLG